MGSDPLSWIGEGGEEAKPGPGVREAGVEEAGEAVEQLRAGVVPKFMTLVPVTARLTDEQVEWLDAAERRIMRSRTRRRERITKNTLLRAAVSLLMALPWDYRDIADEDELVERLKQAAGLG
jgi:hypothetical protein